MRQLAFLLIVAGTALRIIFHLLERVTPWDASVYIGMTKAVATLGAEGLWESLRPIVWPLLLAPFHAVSIPLLPAAHVLQLLIGIGVMLLVWQIARTAFGERAGVWALAFVALSPLLAFYEHQLLTEQPAAFFALLAVWLIQARHWIWAGTAAGVTFLTKFPMGLVIVALVLALWFRKVWRESILVGAGFGIPVLLFMGLNWVLYDNPIAAIIAANDVIKTSGLWLYEEGALFYLRELVMQNLFLAFALPGMLIAWRSQRSVLAVTVFVLGYMTFLPHKEVRFLPLALPFITILAGAGWSLVQSRKQTVITIVTLLLCAVWATQAISSAAHFLVYEDLRDPAQEYIYRRASEGGHIVTTDPRITLFTDKHLELLYYPLFPDNLTLGLDVLKKGTTLYFNPCDVPCAPGNVVCQDNLRVFERHIERDWQLQERLYRNGCSLSRFTFVSTSPRS